jgi:hypothetical protein
MNNQTPTTTLVLGYSKGFTISNLEFLANELNLYSLSYEEKLIELETELQYGNINEDEFYALLETL